MYQHWIPQYYYQFLHLFNTLDFYLYQYLQNSSSARSSKLSSEKRPNEISYELFSISNEGFSSGITYSISFNSISLR